MTNTTKPEAGTCIFISYNRASVETVSSLAEDLATMGHAVWYDQALTGGQRWWDNILEKLRDSTLFMPILTPEALDSQACKRELQYAAALGKPILPLLLSREINPNFLPKSLGEIQFVDYCAQDKAAMVALVRALGGMRGAPPLPDPLPPPPATPLSYLSELSERVDVPQTLDSAAQIVLYHDFKDYLQEQGQAAFAEVSQLLGRFRRRPDLLARVGRDIDAILGAWSAAPPIAAPPAAKPPAVKPPPATATAPEKSDDKGAPPLATPPTVVPAHAAVPALVLILQRTIRLDEIWQIKADDNNHLLIGPSAERKKYIEAELTVRDTLFDAKSKALEPAGWSIDQAGMLKSALAGGALYATGGIAAIGLLSKSVRDELMTSSATKSWKRPDTDAETTAIADELAAAMKILGPDVKRYSAARLDSA